MAACIDNSTNHCIYIASDSPCCQITDPLTSFIKLCHPIYRYPFYTDKFKESPKISPQECTTDNDHITTPQECTTDNNDHTISPQECTTENDHTTTPQQRTIHNDHTITPQQRTTDNNDHTTTPQRRTTDHDPIWLKIRQEAESDAIQEPILSTFYNSSILSHTSLESALSHQLSTKLSTPNLPKHTLHPIFLKTLIENPEIRTAIRADLAAAKHRDPACITHVHCLLNFKGFLAVQAHRTAHKLWAQNRTALALVIQSRVSEVFSVDIHPGAKLGKGIVLDHGTGVVVGETAVVGDDVTVMHGVTLGGTGKVGGDRHPKIGDGVLVGAGAKVLGNVRVGETARVGAGAVVLKEVPAGATAVGNPARVVG